jgi:alpha-aminoadipate carrier protein LysW
MVNCPECNSQIDVEEEELDEGDVLSCDECGATVRVLGVGPLELEAAADEEDGEEPADPEDGEDEHWR